MDAINPSADCAAAIPLQKFTQKQTVEEGSMTMPAGVHACGSQASEGPEPVGPQ